MTYIAIYTADGHIRSGEFTREGLAGLLLSGHITVLSAVKCKEETKQCRLITAN